MPKFVGDRQITHSQAVGLAIVPTTAQWGHNGIHSVLILYEVLAEFNKLITGKALGADTHMKAHAFVDFDAVETFAQASHDLIYRIDPLATLEDRAGEFVLTTVLPG